MEYQVGDLLLLSSRNLNFKNVPAKLQKKFVGPFEVTEKIGSQAYRLKLPDTWSIHDVFHVSLLKKWRTSAFRTDTANVDAELAIEEKKKNVVERILRWKRTGRNRPHAYLVLWKDYPPEEATWESANQFDQEDLKQLLARDAPPEELSNERGRSF